MGLLLEIYGLGINLEMEADKALNVMEAIATINPEITRIVSNMVDEAEANGQIVRVSINIEKVGH